MSDAESCVRFVLAECVETGVTRCFARLGARVERIKDPFHRRKWKVYYYPRHGLSPIYSGDGANWSGLEKSPFWKNPRLAAPNEIPVGVQIP